MNDSIKIAEKEVSSMVQTKIKYELMKKRNIESQMQALSLEYADTVNKIISLREYDRDLHGDQPKGSVSMGGRNDGCESPRSSTL